MKRPEIEKIVRYSAVIGIELERSDVRWDAPPAAVRDALERPPTWPAAWPEPASAIDSLVLALMKLAVFLDWDPRVEGATPAEIRAGIKKRFSGVAGLQAAPRGVPYHPEVYICSDGLPRWEYELSSEHMSLPGMGFTSENGKTDLEIYLQNTMRADLRERLTTATG